MDEDTNENNHVVDESCYIEQSLLQYKMEMKTTDREETVQEKQDKVQNYTKKDNVMKKVMQILYTTQYCSLCMETEGALMSICRCLKIHGLYGDGKDDKVSIKEVLSNIFGNISDFLTSYICQNCVDEAVQSYTFIYNSKLTVKFMKEYITEIHCKVSSLDNHIDVIEDQMNSKYLIVIEPSMNDFSGADKAIAEKEKEDSRNFKLKSEELTKIVRGPTLIVDGTKNRLEIRNDVAAEKVSSFVKDSKKPDMKEYKKPNRSVKCKICFKTPSNPNSLSVHYKSHNRTKCRICQMFVPYSQLQLHLQVHHQDSVYSCDYCNTVYYTESSLAKHIEIHCLKYDDDSESDHQCVTCLKYFSKTAVLKHLCRYKCSECNTTSCPHQKYLSTYRVSRFNNQATKCPDCDYSCTGKYNLIEHVNRVHLDFHQHKCTECGLEYFSQIMLEAHNRYAHSQELVCEYCDQTFQDDNDFANHDIEMCKLDFRKFGCDECKASFDAPNMLSIHKDCRHKEIPSVKMVKNDKTILRYPSKSDIRNIKKRAFQCQICKMVFGYKADYMEHVMELHGPNYTCHECNENFNELKAFLLHYNQQHSDSLVCEMCGKAFETQRKLIRHMRIGHTQPLQCHICTKMIRAISMKSHMRWHKVKENPSLKKPVVQRLYKCDDCGRSLTNKQVLISHINRHHLKVKPFKCKICGVAYSCNYQLNDHTNSHSEEKRHKCNVCGKTLRNRFVLKKHVMLHTGERPHVCDICGQGCITLTRLKEHAKRHAEKQLNCPLCNRKFYMIKNLRYHIKHGHWDHKDQPFDHRLVEGLTVKHDYIFQDGRTVNRL